MSDAANIVASIIGGYFRDISNTGNLDEKTVATSNQ